MLSWKPIIRDVLTTRTTPSDGNNKQSLRSEAQVPENFNMQSETSKLMLFISEIQLDYHNIPDLCVLVHNRQESVYSVEPVGIPAAERTSFWLVKHRIDRN